MHGHGCRVEREETHRDTHRDGFLHEGGHDARRRHRHVHTPRLIEEPLVLRIIQARDDAGDRKLGLCQQGDDQVRLVVARGSNHHVGLSHARVAQGIGRTCVCEHPVSVRNRGNAQFFRHVVDQGDVVTVSEELQCDAASHRTGTGNDDLHAHSSVLGALAS